MIVRQKAFPAHEELIFGSGLTMIAGALDAYSYLEHGAVFAGLQTGNLILLGINFGHLQLAQMGRYLTALLAFSLGTALARLLQHFLAQRKASPQNVALWVEFAILIIALATTNVIPDWAATALLSLAAAVELQEFRRIKGAPFTPLMMTGNLRTATESLVDGLRYHDREARGKATDTFAVLGSFIVGAVLVAAFSNLLAGYAILVPIVLVAALIFWLYQQNHRRQWKH